VIKEFRFALADASWSGYKAYQREIEVLQQLAHPRIPRYLDAFDTAQGFCLVQEYKNAPSLAERRSFTPDQIQQIAVSLLEILVDLQKHVPPIIHRDIKPENILVDKHLNAYLVDFGFARIRGGEMALSSVVAGTPGFIPPEEQFGRPLTEASDLYSVGVTLICLLTNRRSLDIGRLIDDNYRFDLKRLVPQLNPGLIAWLEKMVASNVKQRFPNAAVALEAIKSEQWVSKANGLDSLVSVIKRRKLTYGLGLATLSIVAGMGTTLIVFKPERQVSHLLAWNKCPRCNLRGIHLENGKLEDANLGRANLENAVLERVNLGNADLENANLEDANLKNGKLENANLENAKLENANLENGDLENANLRRAKLERANLGNADLENGKLGRANLVNANLERANLENADLENAKLKRANLGRVNLERANLWQAKLERANLWQAKLRNANLGNADLENANLEDANLEGSNLKNANLKDANLKDVNFKDANLRDVNLENANLKDANLRGVNLEDVNLKDANLENVDLRDANLEGVNLKDANLKDAIMPDGTKHP
jgi:uncharacterized protein YjbI with pentapeptide repeats